MLSGVSLQLPARLFFSSPSPVDSDHPLYPMGLFDQTADQTIDFIVEYFDSIDPDLLDSKAPNNSIELESGVLNLNLGDLGTWTINKFGPNRQIWLSSPISGPQRFDYSPPFWIHTQSREPLQSVLSSEFSQFFDTKSLIDLFHDV